MKADTQWSPAHCCVARAPPLITPYCPLLCGQGPTAHRPILPTAVWPGPHCSLPHNKAPATGLTSPCTRHGHDLHGGQVCCTPSGPSACCALPVSPPPPGFPGNLSPLPWRSLIGCSPRGHEESDTTERLNFHFSPSCIEEGNGTALKQQMQEAVLCSQRGMNSCTRPHLKAKAHSWPDVASLRSGGVLKACAFVSQHQGLFL